MNFYMRQGHAQDCFQLLADLIAVMAEDDLSERASDFCKERALRNMQAIISCLIIIGYSTNVSEKGERRRRTDP